MHLMTLHAQADLWRYEAATFAALFMEGEIRSPDNSRSLRHAAQRGHEPGTALNHRPDPAGGTAAWREAAAEHGGETIVFSTGEGDKLDSVREGRVLTFEVDAVERHSRRGGASWSSGAAE
jgi:hypothetical protein